MQPTRVKALGSQRRLPRLTVQRTLVGAAIGAGPASLSARFIERRQIRERIK
jgi:hypothetical protein